MLSAIILGIFSYNFFNQTTNNIQKLAINDLKTNSEIEAHGISNSLSNAISTITSNVELIANAPSVVERNISKAQSLIDIAQVSTNYLTDGYYLMRMGR